MESFFATVRNCCQVHGFAIVGAFTPAAFRSVMFAKTLYVCRSDGTPVILLPYVVVPQMSFGIEPFRLAGRSGARSAR